jgi:hypothetical protein
MSHAVTKLFIYFAVEEGCNIADAIGKLPQFVQDSFSEHSPGMWSGDFIISCPIAPKLADGDFVDDFAPHFPGLLRLKQFYDAAFELQIAVGEPGPNCFEVKSHMVALLAALGADIVCTTSTNQTRVQAHDPA